jgi:hypothetical protein
LANCKLPLFWGPATSLHGQQCRRQRPWMISYSQVGQSFFFHETNCYVAVYFCLIVTLQYPSVTVTIFMWLCHRLNIKHIVVGWWGIGGCLLFEKSKLFSSFPPPFPPPYPPPPPTCLNPPFVQLLQH